MWHYDQYRGRTSGRILHAIEVYCGLDAAEYVQIGDGKVMLRGELIATYRWDGDSDTPVMEWFGKKSEEYKRNEFLMRPFLDDREIAMRKSPRYVVQLIQQEISLWDALVIQDFVRRDVAENDFYPSIKHKTTKIIADHYPNRSEVWWHFAKAAVYDMTLPDPSTLR